MSLTINYYAAAKASVGRDTQELDFDTLPRDGDGRVTRGAVENALIAAHPTAPAGEQPLAEVLERCRDWADVTIVDTVPRGVDTPADLETARRILAKA